jgi:Cu/Ag efflux protein CusF
VTVDGKEAKLEDLKADDRVAVQLSVDGKKVLAVTSGRARGRGDGERGRVSGPVKSVDAKANTLTLAIGRGGDRTFDLTGATVTIDGKPAKLEDLKEGMAVALAIDAEGKKATAAVVTGEMKAFVFKSAGKDKIAVEAYRRRGQPAEDASFAIEGVKVTIDGKEAKLEDLKEGDRIMAQLSVDAKKVLSITVVRSRRGERPAAPTPRAGGSVKSVDAKANTLTLVVGREKEEKTYELAAGATVTIDGKPAKLEELKEGAAVSLVLDAEGKKATAVATSARRRGER